MKKYKFIYVQLKSTWKSNPGVNDGGFILKWAAKNVGFGELAFYKKDNKTICDNECMDRNFINQAIQYWLNSIEYKDK